MNFRQRMRLNEGKADTKATALITEVIEAKQRKYEFENQVQIQEEREAEAAAKAAATNYLEKSNCDQMKAIKATLDQITEIQSKWKKKKPVKRVGNTVTLGKRD